LLSEEVPMASTLRDLEARRDAILAEMAHLGDMRAGSITENYRRCGKPSCRCAAADDPGHGPYYAYTWKEGGKTRTRNLRPGPELDRLRRQVEHYRSFRKLSQELVDINEEICDLRSVEEDQRGWMKKKRRRNSGRRSPAR
jgi:hypothetical protein